ASAPFFLCDSLHPPDLRSFPTRRSSDLDQPERLQPRGRQQLDPESLFSAVNYPPRRGGSASGRFLRIVSGTADYDGVVWYRTELGSVVLTSFFAARPDDRACSGALALSS